MATLFGCTGKNISPQLSWDNIPKNAKSLALTEYDIDAPTGSGFWHWIVYDIHPSTKSLVAGASTTNAMPGGSVEATNDYGTKGYLGACPPKGNGKHRYQFTIYALDVDKLPVPTDASSAITRFVLYNHIIDKATVTAYAETK